MLPYSHYRILLDEWNTDTGQGGFPSIFLHLLWSKYHVHCPSVWPETTSGHHGCNILELMFEECPVKQLPKNRKKRDPTTVITQNILAFRELRHKYFIHPVCRNQLFLSHLMETRCIRHITPFAILKSCLQLIFSAERYGQLSNLCITFFFSATRFLMDFWLSSKKYWCLKLTYLNEFAPT